MSEIKLEDLSTEDIEKTLGITPTDFKPIRRKITYEWPPHYILELPEDFGKQYQLSLPIRKQTSLSKEDESKILKFFSNVINRIRNYKNARAEVRFESVLGVLEEANDNWDELRDALALTSEDKINLFKQIVDLVLNSVKLDVKLGKIKLPQWLIRWIAKTISHGMLDYIMRMLNKAKK